jgi:hypothetical protein
MEKRSQAAADSFREAAKMLSPLKRAYSMVTGQSGQYRELSELASEWSAAQIRGELSIAGRVLNREGLPLPGIEVVATALNLADAELGATGAQERTFSSQDGVYQFEDLSRGQYEVRTEASEWYQPSRVRVNTGTYSADLILLELQEICARGRVRSTEGELLDRVSVFQVDRPGRKTLTDEDGQYRLCLEMPEGARILNLGFQREGFQGDQIRVPESRVALWEDFRVDAELTPIVSLTTVSGTVKTVEGQPVVGETIRLVSPTQLRSYQAVSRSEGWFLISEVEPGTDYLAMIRPQGPYQDFTLEGLAISDQRFRLDIRLKPRGEGHLVGRMLDGEGNPLPGITLWLRSPTAEHRAIRVTGDQSGHFMVSQVPAGALLLESREVPYFRIDGIHLTAGEQKEVEVILDVGSCRLLGRIVDDRGMPVGGSQITLSKDHMKNGIISRSVRSAMTDANGHFLFTQLGRGTHRLGVLAQLHGETSLDVDVGHGSSEVVVPLPKVKQSDVGRAGGL